MPLNLLKKYNQLLDINGLSPDVRTVSLRAIFNRDIGLNQGFNFRSKIINPTPKAGEIPMDTLFIHLTKKIVDKKTRRREFDLHRSVRLHWVKHHINERERNGMLIFSCKDKKGFRTYIYDQNEFYTIVLEPLRKVNEYYLLTAYHLRGGDRFKIENKYKRKLHEVL